MLVAWLIFPLILLALCVGVGLLIDVLSGRRMPGPLIPVTGLAGVIVVGSFTTMTSTTAPWTVPVLIVLGAIGAFLSRPWRFGRPDRLATGLAVAVFLVYGAPVIASGTPTFAGYVKLDDTATWIAMTDRVMDHGRSLEGLEPSTHERTLAVYSGDGYPIGANLPWGAAGKLVWIDDAWTFQPYMAFLGAMLALVLFTLARALLTSRLLAALVAFVAAQPALLYGFSLWGGVKEVLAAALIGLAAAVLPMAVRAVRGPTGDGSAGHHADGERSAGPLQAREAPAAVLPLALAVAALAATLSFGGMVWVAPLLAGGAVWAVLELGLRGAVIRAAWLALAGAVLTIPVIATGRLTPPVENPVTSEAVLNLLQPLSSLQVFGIWPTEDFRFRPDALGLARALALLAGAAGLVGAYYFVSRRAWAAAGFLATSVIACLIIAVTGSPWITSKAMATASAPILFASMLGAGALFELARRSSLDLKIAAGALVAVLSLGVVWSNALAYTDPSLAPYDRFAELEQIGEEFAGEGPALMTEYNPYGARHFLRELDPEGASELRHRPVNLREGGTPEKGEDVDVDRIELESVLPYRTIVIEQSPDQSRPPAPYELTGLGDHYEVWQRPVEQNMVVLSHMPVTGEGVAYGVPDCSQVRGLGMLAMIDGIDGARLVAAPPDRQAPLVELPLDRAAELCGREWDWIATVLG